MLEAPELLGCDFSSRPTPKKQIVLASGRLSNGVVKLLKLERFASISAWSDRLQRGDWVGGFDLPFGLPRELVDSLSWPTEWLACVRHFTSLDRGDIRNQFKAFCDARPTGGKFAHRATDGPAGSSPSMKWVNPPVAWMMHAGVPVLLESGAIFPGLLPHAPDPAPGQVRVALEAYPGMLARELLQSRGASEAEVVPKRSPSYKSDDKTSQTPARLLARKDMLTALEQGRTRLGLRLKLTPAQSDVLVADASGDSLDAVLCLVQVAWAWQCHLDGDDLFGLPPGTDPLEGWIITA